MNIIDFLAKCALMADVIGVVYIVIDRVALRQSIKEITPKKPKPNIVKSDKTRQVILANKRLENHLN